MTQLVAGWKKTPGRWELTARGGRLRQEDGFEAAATVPMLESTTYDELLPALKVLQDALPRDAIIVTEGASTMDISRQDAG